MMQCRWPDVAITVLLCLAAPTRGQAQVVPRGSAVQPQPPDLSYVLSTKDSRTSFHLGEIIEIDEAYSSNVPGKYLLVALPQKIKGHSARFTMKPEQNVVDRVRDDGTRSAFSILHANCTGMGGGIGDGCGDCDGTYPLNRFPIHFPFLLNAQFQIMKPGHYIIQAEAASIVEAPLDVERSVPISLASNTVEIEVIDDPVWSKQALENALTRFEAAHAKYVENGWDKLPRDQMSPKDLEARFDLEWKIGLAAGIMSVLDTEDSLKEIVRLYDGARRNPDYLNPALLRGIIQSKHRSLAINLLNKRILEPDFAVSRELLDQLTAMTLESQIPDSFSGSDDDSRRALYPAARAILHDYVLALGNSLAEKSPGALESSLKAFKTYATEDFCTREPLIPEAAFQQLLRQVQAFDSNSED